MNAGTINISDKSIKASLRQYFGFTEFKKGQEDVIRAILQRRDALGVMPTGGGKSLCYQLPAIMLPGTALVISPLISLMKDQVDALQKRNIEAAFINSSLPFMEIQNRLEMAARGEFKLIYIAPERLQSNRFIEMLKRVDTSFIAVDEAHCISEWGHDFRPSYLHISEAVKQVRINSVAALTATATPEVQDDIISSLRMKNTARVVRGFDRPNLSYKTIDSSDKLTELLKICGETPDGSVIIYCGSRKRVESFADSLIEHGIQAETYHAGMSQYERKRIQDKFINDKARIIVATNAFGMGIDKPDVRKVVHCDLTQTLEAYYQEAGRAGRDGEPSDCILLYHPADTNLQEFFIKMTFPDKEDIALVYNFLYDLNAAALGKVPDTPIYLDSIRIANRLNIPEKSVSSVLSLLERNSILRKNNRRETAKIQITVTRERLVDYYRNTTDERRKVLEALLRSVSAEALRDETEIDLHNLRKKFDLKKEEIARSLQAFEFARLMKYQSMGGGGGYRLVQERKKFENLDIDFTDFDKRRDHAYRKLDIVVRFAETSDCKRNFILDYFREEDINGICGKCSSCTGKRKKSARRSQRRIKLLKSLLSAAIVLDGRFGKTVLTDFVHGKKSAKIEKFNLHKAEYFSCCKEFADSQISSEIESALYDRLLTLSTDIYSTVKITEAGKEWLDEMPKPFDLPEISQNIDKNLYNEMIRLRDDLAQREGIVPRAVAANTAIRKLAAELPRNKEQMKNVSGIGPIFIEKFGNYFLSVIKEHLTREDKKKAKKSVKLPRDVQSAVSYMEQKLPLSEIARKMNISEGIAARYIQQAIDTGYEPKLNDYFSENLESTVTQIIQNHPRSALKDIRARIDGNVNYPELRILTAIVRHKLKQ